MVQGINVVATNFESMTL